MSDFSRGGNNNSMPPPPIVPPRGSPPGPTQEMKRNPPRQSNKRISMSRPDIDAARGGNPDFNDAENMISYSARAEMKGPGDLRDILAGLKTKTNNISEGKKEGSTISLQELEEIQSTDLSSKNNKMVKRIENVVNLGI